MKIIWEKLRSSLVESGLYMKYEMRLSKYASWSLVLWLTVAPGQNVKVEDTWNFFIVLTVRGGQGE